MQKTAHEQLASYTGQQLDLNTAPWPVYLEAYREKRRKEQRADDVLPLEITRTPSAKAAITGAPADIAAAIRIVAEQGCIYVAVADHPAAYVGTQQPRFREQARFAVLPDLERNVSFGAELFQYSDLPATKHPRALVHRLAHGVFTYNKALMAVDAFSVTSRSTRTEVSLHTFQPAYLIGLEGLLHVETTGSEAKQETVGPGMLFPVPYRSMHSIQVDGRASWLAITHNEAL